MLLDGLNVLLGDGIEEAVQKGALRSRTSKERRYVLIDVRRPSDRARTRLRAARASGAVRGGLSLVFLPRGFLCPGSGGQVPTAARTAEICAPRTGSVAPAVGAAHGTHSE